MFKIFKNFGNFCFEKTKNKYKMTNTCAVCGVPAHQKCGGCKNVSYCGKEHQKIHWKKGHKAECKCYEVFNIQNSDVYVLNINKIYSTGGYKQCARQTFGGHKRN